MTEKISTRQLKKKIAHLFLNEPYESAVKTVKSFPVKQVVNPLISFLCSNDDRLKMSAVKALGEIVSRIAKENREEARVIMRRLMWHLNDESGGIGWGVPEAMGEIMAHDKSMADEYLKILISYTDPGFNYLENPVLQKGAHWGINRVLSCHPDLKQKFPY